MNWSHPGRGTCVPGCPLWGGCHCGCGSSTSLAVQNRLNGRGKAVRGRPLLWVHGHAARWRQTGGGAAWTRRGIPAERVRPLAEFLVRLYGTQRAAAQLAGVSESSLSLLRKGGIRRVSPPLAQRIVDLVLASRRPRDPMATFELEVPRRLATVRERKATPAPRPSREDVASEPAWSSA